MWKARDLIEKQLKVERMNPKDWNVLAYLSILFAFFFVMQRVAKKHVHVEGGNKKKSKERSKMSKKQEKAKVLSDTEILDQVASKKEQELRPTLEQRILHYVIALITSIVPLCK